MVYRITQQVRKVKLHRKIVDGVQKLEILEMKMYVIDSFTFYLYYCEFLRQSLHPGKSVLFMKVSSFQVVLITSNRSRLYDSELKPIVLKNLS